MVGNMRQSLYSKIKKNLSDKLSNCVNREKKYETNALLNKGKFSSTRLD